ncbi:MAG: sensor histidine kinase [Solirubrobacteraceae bacterium]|nr:sensor histidine kinase [Solirubrobacteraceae bacterium]
MDALVQLAEIRRRPPPADLALAGGLLVWALLEAAFVAGPGPDWARYLAAPAFAVPFVWRRRWPVAVLLVVVGALVVRAATTSGAESGAMPFPALLLGAFSVALYGRPAWLAIAAAPLPIAGFASAAALGFVDGDPTPVDVAILSFISLGAWTGGWVVRRRAAALARAEAAAPALARDAVAAERARMARELHDIVAHSVSIIAVQAGAAEALLDAGDREKARAHVQAVRHTAHEALVELRRLLGVLREEDPEYRPQPGLARLDELLEDARRAGLRVELEQDDLPERIPAGVDLAAYRIVQEGLTNARRHAGAVRAVVRVRHDGGRLELEVLNDPAAGRAGTESAGSGHGLAGMRERARLSGGTLEAGPLGDGGFRVHASLPTGEPAA